MINVLLYQIKSAITRLFLNRKKATHKRLKSSFGKLKDDAFNFSMIREYFQYKDHVNVHQVLSDKTCNDLDFEALFMLVDRTHSKIGQQYLYNQLRVLNPDEKQTALNEEIIAEIMENEALRISFQKRIEKLNHKDAFYVRTLFQDEQLQRPKWFSGIQLLSFLSISSILLSFFNPVFFGVFVGIFCINFIIHYWNKKNLVHYVSSIPQLLRLNAVAAHLFTNASLKKIQPNLSKSIGIINAVKNRMSFFQLEAKLQGEFEILAWLLFEILKIAFLLEPLVLFGVVARLHTKRSEIEDVYKFVGHVDMLISIASLRKGLDVYCKPTITTKNEINVTEIRHPLIFDCVTNSIQIGAKSLLLTGSNMSGKTSFIRAIGLNVITGITLNTCFATSMSFPLMRIFSAIRISDDVLNEKSYYFEEVTTIKEMILESKKETINLFLLDELFKGTNTVERIAAGKAVLSMLANNANKVLVSTHDIELTELLAETFDLYHFSEIIEKNNVAFDYKLKEGKLQHRNAIRILEMNAYPKEVIAEAMAISKELDASYVKQNES